MSVVASDLVIYGSASMPNDDVDVNIGGAIDLDVRVSFSDIVATDQIEVLSDNAGDTTQTLTVYSRNEAGELVSEVINLNGTNVVLGALTDERILRAVLSAACTGTITVRDQDTDTTIMTFEPGLLEIRRPFYNAYSDVSGGAERKYYEKVFYRNNNGTTSLTTATIAEAADPSTVVAFALESSLDGTDTNGAGNNRLVAPGGYTFNSDTKNVANSQNHSAGSGQGIWLELTLAAGLASNNTSFTLQEAGQTV